MSHLLWRWHGTVDLSLHSARRRPNLTYMLLLVEGNNGTNITHWGSRTTNSVKTEVFNLLRKRTDGLLKVADCGLQL